MSLRAGIEFTNEQSVKPDIHESVIFNGVIDCAAKVTIERGVFTGHDVMILTGSHDPNKFWEDRRKSSNPRPVTIKEYVWISSRSTILGGVTIGENSVIAAGAVVTKSVPSYEMWGGVPARKIREL